MNKNVSRLRDDIDSTASWSSSSLRRRFQNVNTNMSSFDSTSPTNMMNMMNSFQNSVNQMTSALKVYHTPNSTSILSSTSQKKRRKKPKKKKSNNQKIEEYMKKIKFYANNMEFLKTKMNSTKDEKMLQNLNKSYESMNTYWTNTNKKIEELIHNIDMENTNNDNDSSNTKIRKIILMFEFFSSQSQYYIFLGRGGAYLGS